VEDKFSRLTKGELSTLWEGLHCMLAEEPTDLPFRIAKYAAADEIKKKIQTAYDERKPERNGR
jgi:hypothetical protein